ncbi:CRISPR-associated helicase Cas3' [Streptomyces sp. RFCAC02]|uniref:CRISPR-associated helicase Cas3' n=1 Tax=Streptomyces sp. RFCAC02 TaxID=2499143 RepID=UPI0010217595|nr:CRISPR-associated helicase Cas3' [Streptomyces sp. RFCAC02]
MKELRAKSATKGGRPGELLTSHLLNTLTALDAIRARIGDIPGVPAEFWTWAALAALFHDTGKVPAGFQRMVGNTTDPAKPWGERHEVLSLGFVEGLLTRLSPRDRLWVGSIVAAHHRSFTCGLDRIPAKTPIFNLYGDDEAADFLSRFTPTDQARLTELIIWLRTTVRQHDLPGIDDLVSPDISPDELAAQAHRLFQEVYDRWSTPLRVSDPDGRTAILLLGVVTMADHLSSAHASLDTQHPLTPAYPATLSKRLAVEGHPLRPQQNDAARADGHLLLRSWTGSGKTEAALLWASRQIDTLSRTTGGTSRVFYLLPYLASINAMVRRLGDELNAHDSIGVAHSRAASYHLTRSLSDDCTDDVPLTDEAGRLGAATSKARSRAKATRNFRELLRVGTPYQLLRGALAGPVHSSVLADSANSVFVLDELHAYDTRRLGMILAMMRFWRDLGGRVAVMSATLPAVLAQLVTDTLQTPAKGVVPVEPPADVPAPARHLLHTRRSHLTDGASISEIGAELAAGKSVLVVANNVRDAISLHRALAPLCSQLHGDDSALLLHSRFRRMDRDTIEQSIQDRFGKDAERRPGLLIGTQAVEVSLDLDFDTCHTSGADLEALLQRFGRVNRYALRSPAPVIVHRPAYTTRRGVGETLWADGIYPSAHRTGVGDPRPPRRADHRREHRDHLAGPHLRQPVGQVLAVRGRRPSAALRTCLPPFLPALR